MKFICDKCKTRYTISDEKVRGKVLKIRCKNCGNVVEVRESTAAPEPPAVRQPTSTQGALKAQRRHGSQVERLKTPVSGPVAAARPGARPSDRRSSDAAVARPRAPQRPVPRSGPGPGPGPGPGTVSAALREPEGDEPKTMIAAIPAEFLKESRAAAGAKPARGAGSAWDDGAAVWYLGDDRGEYGPMTFSELAARVKRGEPGPSAEVWKEGMDDWLALEDVPELKPFLKRAPPPRPTATTRAAPPSPYQKVPEKDAAAVDEEPEAAPRPATPKSLSHTAEFDEPLAKAPAAVPRSRPTPAAEPAAASAVPWPAAPGAPASRPDLDVFSLPTDLPPASQATPAPAAGLGPLPASHVSLRAASDLGSLLVAEQKRARRPILIISLAAVLIAGAAVGLVIWLISSGKKHSEPGPKPPVADTNTAPRPREAPRVVTASLGMEATRPAGDGAEAQELPELDIDVSPGMERPRGPRNRRRNAEVFVPRPRNGAPAPATRVSSGGSADPLALPTHRPRFSGIDNLGGPRPGGGGTAGTGGGAPPNLGTVVKRNYNRLKRCYEQAARLDSRLRNPKLSITIKVSSSGRVKGVYVSPQRYAADTLGICVRRSISAWKFPSFAADYKYAFTARFHGG